MKSAMPQALITQTAVEAVAWERAPRHEGSWVNLRVVCADGFAVSVQASRWHYATDASGEGPFSRRGGEVNYPYLTFEVGNPSVEVEPAGVWDEYDAGGVWARVPRQVVADLLDSHGGAVAWEASPRD